MTGGENWEERLVRLEENGWFQERKLAELEAHARELRLQLSALEKQCENLRHSLGRLEDALWAGHSGSMAGTDSLPPHWREKPEQIIICKKGEDL